MTRRTKFMVSAALVCLSGFLSGVIFGQTGGYNCPNDPDCANSSGCYSPDGGDSCAGSTTVNNGSTAFICVYTGPGTFCAQDGTPGKNYQCATMYYCHWDEFANNNSGGCVGGSQVLQGIYDFPTTCY